MSSKHFITLEYAPIGSKLYAFNIGGMFPRIISVLNGVVTDFTKSYIPFEYIKSSKVRDRFHNRSVCHNFIDGHLNVSVSGIPNITLKTTSNGAAGEMMSYYIGTTKIAQAGYALGSKYVSTGLDWSNWSTNGPTSASKTTYDSNGAAMGHISYALIEPATWDVYNIGYYKYRRVTIVTNAYKKKHPDAVDTDVEITSGATRFTLLGTVTSQGLSKDYILSKIKPYDNYGHLNNIVRDSLFDDVLSNFNILDVNNFENLQDFKDIKKSIPPIAKLLKKRNLKSLAECYLWYKYSYSTTKLDLKSYAAYISSWFIDHSSSRDYRHVSVLYTDTRLESYGSVVQTTRYNLYTENYNAGILNALGLDFNMSNLWDVLPYSFVVDWFINLGDIFEKLDNRETLSEIKIISLLTSNKCTFEISPLSDLGIMSTLRVSRYTRSVDKTLPTPTVSVSLVNPIRHTTDGLALFISRK